MKRSACLLTLMSLVSGACGDDGKGNDGSDSNTTNPTTGGIMLTISASGTETMAEGGDPTGMTGDATSNTPTMSTEPTMGGNTTFDPNDCGESVVNIPIVTPSVMLVLDKSGSMVSAATGFWDHDADDANDDGIADADPNMMQAATPKITRWNSLWTVVELIVTGFNGSMNMGAILFPSKSAESEYGEVACIVNSEPEVPIGAMNAEAIIAAIPPATAGDKVIQGGTPATRGVKTAIKELEGAPADQPKFMILVTDGAANCQENAPDNTVLFEMYDEALAPTIQAAADAGIKTYVVGIDISQNVSGATKDGNPDNTNTYERLNQVAIAGGVPRAGDEKFFNTTNQEELEMALQMISMQILSCTLDLDPSPVYLDYVEVTVKEEYGKDQVKDCATEDGWQYVPKMDPNDPNEPVRIELCGAACSDFQKSGMIDIQYRCPNSG